MELNKFSAEELDIQAMRRITGGNEGTTEGFDDEEEDFESLDGATTSRRTFTTCTGTDHDSRRTDSD